MNSDKTRTEQNNHGNLVAGQVSDAVFKQICTAIGISERMDVVMESMHEVVASRPYGTEEDIGKWNTFQMHVSADLAVLNMRTAIAVHRVKYDCGAMDKERFMEICKEMRDENCVVCAMMELKESELGLPHIMAEPEEGCRQAPADSTEDSTEDEYRIQED